jgi:ABC-type amino acid transport substrate-binding protein
MLQAVQEGKVDVMIIWEPAIGWLLLKYPDLRSTRVPYERATGSPEQYMFPMSLAVRKNDQLLKKKLDGVIARRKSALETILRHYNVRLYPVEGETF